MATFLYAGRHKRGQTRSQQEAGGLDRDRPGSKHALPGRCNHHPLPARLGSLISMRALPTCTHSPLPSFCMQPVLAWLLSGTGLWDHRHQLHLACYYSSSWYCCAYISMTDMPLLLGKTNIKQGRTDRTVGVGTVHLTVDSSWATKENKTYRWRTRSLSFCFFLPPHTTLPAV